MELEVVVIHEFEKYGPRYGKLEDIVSREAITASGVRKYVLVAPKALEGIRDVFALGIGPAFVVDDDYMHAEIAQKLYSGYVSILGGGLITKIRDQEGEYFLLWDESTSYGSAYEKLQEPEMAAALKTTLGGRVKIRPEKDEIEL